MQLKLREAGFKKPPCSFGFLSRQPRYFENVTLVALHVGESLCGVFWRFFLLLNSLKEKEMF